MEKGGRRKMRDGVILMDFEEREQSDHKQCINGGHCKSKWGCENEDLVRRQDLKQVLELMNCGINNQASVVRPSSLCVEQGLSVLRKKHLLRASLAAKHSSQSSWCPALQRIREEI
ncbi:hypothetical protein GBA52_027686 [Prunus armeniaca]|nr:hypothetical protein GBA52_027686 [Prunus armeniaca]